MTLFPVWFLTALVYGAIALAFGGLVALGALLARDLKQRNVW